MEAILLRPGNERFDVSGSLDELRRFSLVDQMVSSDDEGVFVGVPLAASLYGRRKLEASPYKIAVEEDRKLLMEFGAGKRDAVHRGVAPRIESHIRAVAARASSPGELERALPVLEYLATRFPETYLHLADLVLEVDTSASSSDRAKSYLRTFLESVPPIHRGDAWMRLADLCCDTNDVVGEVHALSEAALLPNATNDDLELIANRINNRLRDLKGRRIDEAWSTEVHMLIDRVIAAIEKKVDDLSATGCSRLAWLHLNVGNTDRARDVTRIGIKRDPGNEYCQRLQKRLGN